MAIGVEASLVHNGVSGVPQHPCFVSGVDPMNDLVIPWDWSIDRSGRSGVIR